MSKSMVGRKANAVVSKSSVHHKMLPWCEHVGESLPGESKALVPSNDECFSYRTSSSSSTLTSETSLNQNDDEGDTSWTDDKHSSYLTCMEEMFVRNMYDREYCAVDICGESAAPCEHECVESKPPSNFFKVMQGGDWHPLPCRRLHSWEIPSPALLSSPWIQHFKAKVKLDDDDGAAISEARSNNTGVTENLICKTSTAYELEDDDGPAEVPDVENRSSAWFNSRMNSHSGATTASSYTHREDVSSSSFTGCSRKTKSSGTLVDLKLSLGSGKASILRENKNAGTTVGVQRIFETIDQVVPLVKKCKRWSDTGENWNWTNRMNIVRR